NMNPNNPENKKAKRPPRRPAGASRANGPTKGPGRAGNKPQAGQNAPSRSGVSRGAAVRAQKRSQMDAQKIANQYVPAMVPENAQRQRANVIDDSPRLRIIGLGGMDGGGSKNTMLVEYGNDAVVIDCG